ncbi:hypothetical protein [Sphingomonas sp. IC081]|uniref:hypothetical protein n=1 Tax=Sphingomonas sp. IC081 TaxID=304378 RepID=UPI0011598DA9|nr:hypothetical protein [Sphingomonas sp. IC081]QDK32702.1 hypothetical protein DM450_07875 [Sphingomonas sp. IC081]
MTITDAEYYELVERDRFTPDDFNPLGFAEPLTFVPTPVVIDDDGEEMSDESMRELFEFHASMFNRSMVYDHSTMPDEPTFN